MSNPEPTSLSVETSTTAQGPALTSEPSANTQSASENQTATLLGRANAHQELVMEAIRNPTKNLRYVVFGGILGISACLPTCLHLYLF